MAEESKKVSPPVSKPGRDRSPPYPFISLRVAIDRLTALEKKFGRHEAPMDKLGIAWGMNAKSSQAWQTAAALKSYGLVDYTGTTKERTVALSSDGRKYLRAQQESIKAEILKRCALMPRAIGMCWTKWGADRPPDEVCLDDLILKSKFTEPAARTLLRVYDETIGFAKLSDGDKPVAEASEEEEEEEDDLDPPPPVKPKAGEFVRWESGGVLMFDRRRVLGLSPDGQFVFVEGSATGLPLEEISVVSGPAATTPIPPPNPYAQPEPIEQAVKVKQPPPPGMKEDVFSFPGSNAHAVFQWPTKMTAEELQDLEDWLEIKLRGIKRSIQ